MVSVNRNSSTPQQPRFVFLFGPLVVGGIETMILRVANHLVQQGRSADVCVHPGGELERLFDSRVVIRHYLSIHDLIEHARSIISAGSAPIILVSFDSESAARAVKMARYIGKYSEVRHLTGVFHPTVNFRAGQPRDRIWLNRGIVRTHASHSIFFMNVECRDTHAEWLGMSLRTAPIIPLPVSSPEIRWVPTQSPALRIVSVGRLVDFKAYNLGAAQIVRSLLDDGIPVTWDIYGYGPLESEIASLASKEKVQSELRLRGKLPYNEYHQSILEHDVFVGMGTAAVEAAMAGLPTIVATVSEQFNSYGFVHDLPFGNVGERLAGFKPKLISSLLQHYATVELAVRQEISERGRAAVSGYTIDAFVRGLESMAGRIDSCRPSWLAAVWATLFIAWTEGWVHRIFLGRGVKRRVLALFRGR